MNPVRLAVLAAVTIVALDVASAPLFRMSSAVDLGRAVASPPGPMVAADFNGDTFPDVAIPHMNGRLAVTLSDATGPFGAPQISVVPLYIRGMFAADTDGDGDQDLVYYALDKLGVLMNNGNATFTQGATLTTMTEAHLGGGDVNDDGKVDAVIASGSFYGSAQIAVHFGNGTGGFAAGVISPAAYADMRALGVVVADLNGDGKADVITRGANTVAYVSSANGTLRSVWNGVGGVLAVGRLNADAVPDLVIHESPAYGSDAMLYTLMGQGNGTFAQQIGQWSPVTSAVNVLCVDMNNDQRNDVVTVGATTSVVLGLGNGMVAQPLITMIRVSQDGQFVTVDYDRDGKRDLLTASEYAASVRFHRGNGDGTFRDDRGYLANPANGSATGVSALDMNGDGRPDASALLANADYTLDIAVMRNDGNGGLLPAVKTPTSFPANSMPRFLAGKLNGDGWPDAVTITMGDFGLELTGFLGNGNATFTQLTTIPLTTDFDSYFGRFKLADATGDGTNDLLIENDLYEGNGDGSFEAARATGAKFTVIGDVDGNGTLDAVWREGGSAPFLRVALNTGGGNFSAPTSFGPDGATPHVLADFDDDGVLDLLCTISADPAMIQVFGGVGNGTFKAPVEVLIPRSYWLFEEGTTSDFDGDGDLDVAFGTDVFLGDGTLRFRSLECDEANSSRSYGTAVADFDASGSPDVVEFTGNVAYLFLTRLAPEPARTSTTTIAVNEVPRHATPTGYLSRTSGGNAPLTGSTLFRVDGVPVAIAYAHWSSDEAAAFASMIFALPFGSHNVVAEFLGNETYQPSSAAVTANVERATTAIRHDYSSPYSSPYGTALNVYWDLVASVAEGMAKPSTTGTYVIREGGVALTNVQWGTDTVAVKGLATGTHTLTLEYLGDGHYQPASSTFTVTVQKRTVFASSELSPANRNRVEGPVTITWFIAPPADYGTTTGTVEFKLNQQILGTVALGNHRATFTTGRLAAGTYIVYMTYSGDENTAPAQHKVSMQVYLPTGSLIPVVASAGSKAGVVLDWPPAAEAMSYKIYRRTTFADSWLLIASTAFVSYAVAQPTGTTYMYAIAPGRSDTTIGPIGPPDFATTVPYKHWNVVPGTLITSLQVMELRTGVNAMRAFAGLSAFPFADAELFGASVRALHLTELREALIPARNAIRMPITFSADAPVAGGPIRATHIEELRAGVR